MVSCRDSMQSIFPHVASFKSNSGGGGSVSIESAFGSAEVVGIYFSGAWCVPCQRFTKALARVYHELRSRGKMMEIVFVSEDEDEERMQGYHSEMPWLALRWKDAQRLKERLQQTFSCESFPHLVLVHPHAPFPPITLRGCSAIACGPDAFPFTPSATKAYWQTLYAAAFNLLQRPPSAPYLGNLISRAATERFRLPPRQQTSPLRIITLNIWGGRQLEELIQFFRNHGPVTDIFCLQEVIDTEKVFPYIPGGEPAKQGSVYRAIQLALPDFQSAFARHGNDSDRTAPAMFIRKSLGPSAIVSQLVYDNPNAAPFRGMNIAKYFRLNLQTVLVPLPGSPAPVLVANFHGLWHPIGKIDTPERLEISAAVRAVVDRHDGPLVICGDFNLLPGTDALAILARGLNNPLVERGISCTRTHLYRSFSDPLAPLYADYILPSPQLKVLSFEVLQDVVSDHAALRCELEPAPIPRPIFER
jgi:thiol-disulfide isomerase/thioredoxin